ncbi:UDP-glucuronosyltransferase 2B19 [Dissostichus eleginoides]|uniref:UDP-glucuronosyltransferase 2B19 n=1 Tax=Dissostichus eleginoides TaxID=100907 RepID=A0AAD9F7Q6_DISEL|nr:UDP-glucuronosyltransferase 2B19 [Dissostichus eleginoides]
MYRPILTALAVLLCSSPLVNSGKILVVPVDGSHWINMKVLVEELHSRGHDITVIRPSDSWYIKTESPYYKSITINSAAGFDEEGFGIFVTKMLSMRREGASLSARLSLEYELVEQFYQLNKQMIAMEVLYDPTYREKMRVLSNLHRDQPMKPLDKAMFWIEFVMRNKGAAHLRTESYKMSKIQYHSIDVVAFLLAVVFLVFAVFIYAVKVLWQIFFSRNKVKKE